jgi:hypothetical protein
MPPLSPGTLRLNTLKLDRLGDLEQDGPRLEAYGRIAPTE